MPVVRAERAEILRIALSKAVWRDERAFSAAARLLRERYRVPVGGLEDVPNWVKQNRRDPRAAARWSQPRPRSRQGRSVARSRTPPVKTGPHAVLSLVR